MKRDINEQANEMGPCSQGKGNVNRDEIGNKELIATEVKL